MYGMSIKWASCGAYVLILPVNYRTACRKVGTVIIMLMVLGIGCAPYCDIFKCRLNVSQMGYVLQRDVDCRGRGHCTVKRVESVLKG